MLESDNITVTVHKNNEHTSFFHPLQKIIESEKLVESEAQSNKRYLGRIDTTSFSFLDEMFI